MMNELPAGCMLVKFIKPDKTEEDTEKLNSEDTFQIMYLNQKFRSYLGIDDKTTKVTDEHVEKKNMVQHFFKTKKNVKALATQRINCSKSSKYLTMRYSIADLVRQNWTGRRFYKIIKSKKQGEDNNDNEN